MPAGVAADARVAVALRLSRPWPRAVAAPAAVVLVGPPGVGKTAVARALRRRVPVAVIESDAVRRALYAEPAHDAAEHAAVFETVHGALRALLRRGVATVIDATNLVEAHRTALYEIAEEAGARVIVVRVTAPAALVRRRLEAGGERGASTAGVREFEAVRRRQQRLRRHHHIIDTQGDMREAVEAVAREIEGR